MATNLTNSTFSSTYKDDFRDSDGYHRILFNTGRALQARELTQIQTILQNQVSRMGNNIFKEGSLVRPGGVNINPKFEYVRLNPTNHPATDLDDYVGVEFTGTDSQIKAKVLRAEAAGSNPTTDPVTLYVRYTSTVGETSTSSTTTKRFRKDELLTGGSFTLQVENNDDFDAVGVGTIVNFADGVYYTRGHFVFAEAQSKIISRYTDTATTEIGYQVVEDVVTTSDDTGLFDNQGATPNETAPGADRYRIKLTIAEKKDVTGGNDNFIFVASIKESVIYKAINENDAYNIPNKMISERIKENSGDYIVKPFVAHFEPDSADDHLLLRISDGIVVVDGFRAARSYPTRIRVPKVTATGLVENEQVGANFGNYVIVDPGSSVADTDSATKGLPNINEFEKMNIHDSQDNQGSIIGTARVKAVSEEGANYRYHLFDVQMNSGKAFRDAKSIGTSISNTFNIKLEASKAVLKEANTNTSLFRLPKNRPQSFVTNSITFTAQKRFTGTTTGGGSLTLNLPDSSELFTNTGDWVFAAVDSDVITPTTRVGAQPNPVLSLAGKAVTVTNLPASKSMEVLAYVNKRQASHRTKTLTTKSDFYPISTVGDNTIVQLPKADIFSIEYISDSADAGTTKPGELYTDRFSLDNGQRDNHYARGRLILRDGQTSPGSAGTYVYVKYQYFEHGNDGEFFARPSYVGTGVRDDLIPNFTASNGQLIRLIDHLDFRSVMDSNGEFTGTQARIHNVPQPGTAINLDVNYYLLQAGKIVIDREGVLKYITGNTGFNPKPPQIPVGSLGLYDIRLNPNTQNDSDLAMSKLEYRRFTMKDIGVLENRLANLEEVASLSLLETATEHFQVLDSAGNDRTKSGFFVDNFVDHTFSDAIPGTQYRASIDPIEHTLRPAFTEDNVKLVFDSANSTNVWRKGDNIYMHYNDSAYIDQSLASKAISVNPFGVAIYDGTIVLSPSSDEWRDTERLANKILSTSTRLSPKNAYNWNNWSWSWGGLTNEDLKVGSQTNTISGAYNKVVSEETILDLVEDKVLQTAFAPFIRSRKVYFKATGMRPNTRLYAFFDGKHISDSATGNYVNVEDFVNYGADGNDNSNIFKNETSFPNATNQTLNTDANGSITGAFIIPNNADLKFRTGTREFRLMDISAYNIKFAASTGRASYTASGLIDTKQGSYNATRVLTVQGEGTLYGTYYSSSEGDDGNTVVTTVTASHANDWTTGSEGDFPDSYSHSSGDNSSGGGYDASDFSSSGSDNGGHEALCLLEDMKVMLNGRITEVTNVKVGDIVSYGVVTEVIHKHMRSGYYIINDELKITNDHPVLVNGSWKKAEDVVVGEYINNVKVESTRYVEKIVPTVFIATNTESYDVYCGSNVYTVHGDYRQVLQKAS